MAFGKSPTREEIEALASAALDTIPERLRRHTEGVAIRVEEFPDEGTCHEMELESPFDLLGLYHGVPLAEKGVSDPGGTIDIVFLYRRPILDYWAEYDEDLPTLVRHVLIHEIGHHFGFSDDDMEALEAEAERDEAQSKS